MRPSPAPSRPSASPLRLPRFSETYEGRLLRGIVVSFPRPSAEQYVSVPIPTLAAAMEAIDALEGVQAGTMPAPSRWDRFVQRVTDVLVASVVVAVIVGSVALWWAES